MKIIEKFILFVKKIFIKENEIKKIEAPKITNEQNQKNNFINSLICDTTEKKKIETLICKGDGLGIQKKISY